MKTFKIEGRPEHAGKYRDWLLNRGGIAVWKSADLGCPDLTWCTPADVLTKPSWQCAQAPEIVIDPAQVGIYTEVLYKRVRVVLRMSRVGTTAKLTFPSQQKVDKAMAACRESHGDAHYRTETDVDGPGVNVYYTASIEPLNMEQDHG